MGPQQRRLEHRRCAAHRLRLSGAINDEALRDATGFDESTAPDTTGMTPELVLALKLVEANPTASTLPPSGPALPVTGWSVRPLVGRAVALLLLGGRCGGAEALRRCRAQGTKRYPTPGSVTRYRG